jgi:hypothetical protein
MTAKVRVGDTRGLPVTHSQTGGDKDLLVSIRRVLGPVRRQTSDEINGNCVEDMRRENAVRRVSVGGRHAVASVACVSVLSHIFAFACVLLAIIPCAAISSAFGKLLSPGVRTGCSGSLVCCCGSARASGAGPGSIASVSTSNRSNQRDCRAHEARQYRCQWFLDGWGLRSSARCCGAHQARQKKG